MNPEHLDTTTEPLVCIHCGEDFGYCRSTGGRAECEGWDEHIQGLDDLIRSPVAIQYQDGTYRVVHWGVGS